MSFPRRLTLTMPLHAGLSVGHTCAAKNPLWEPGVSISALSFPDYRGSDESSFYAIPYPDLVYRGTFLKADRRGIRGTFFDSDRVELNVSLGASLPVRTAVTVKVGMDDVGWVFSPRLNLDISDVAGLAGWNMGLHAGPIYGPERNHDYGYSVAPQYATAARPLVRREDYFAAGVGIAWILGESATRVEAVE